jgi:hypothetical protein
MGRSCDSWEGVDLIDQWRAVMNTAVNLRVESRWEVLGSAGATQSSAVTLQRWQLPVGCVCHRACALRHIAG